MGGLDGFIINFFFTCLRIIYIYIDEILFAEV